MIDRALSGRPQTNIQLYCSLIEHGRSSGDLREIREAYDLASRIFAGQVRPEGRPFTCHVVGVAGILAALGESTPVICAGLLHSALSHGDIGAGIGHARGITRRLLARAVDGRTFDLVDRYSELSWNPRALVQWTVAGSIPDGTSRELILIRLANELDDSLDRAEYFSDKGGARRKGVPAELFVAVARMISEERLATALEATMATDTATEDFRFLQAARRGSFVEAPMSYRRRRLLPKTLRLQDSAHRAVRFARRLISTCLRSSALQEQNSVARRDGMPRP